MSGLHVAKKIVSFLLSSHHFFVYKMADSTWKENSLKTCSKQHFIPIMLLYSGSDTQGSQGEGMVQC